MFNDHKKTKPREILEKKGRQKENFSVDLRHPIAFRGGSMIVSNKKLRNKTFKCQ